MLKKLRKQKKNQHLILTEKDSLALTLNDILYIFNYGYLTHLKITNLENIQTIISNNISITLSTNSPGSLTIQYLDPVTHKSTTVYENDSLNLILSQQEIGDQIIQIYTAHPSLEINWINEEPCCILIEKLVQSLHLRISNKLIDFNLKNL